VSAAEETGRGKGGVVIIYNGSNCLAPIFVGFVFP
jgi:hypothetical protein